MSKSCLVQIFRIINLKMEVAHVPTNSKLAAPMPLPTHMRQAFTMLVWVWLSTFLLAVVSA